MAKNASPREPTRGTASRYASSPPTAAAATNVNFFNPRDKKFYACCCHTKAFTLAFGVVEIFLICFLLISVVPELSTRLCMDNEDANLAHKTDFGELPTQQETDSLTTTGSTSPSSIIEAQSSSSTSRMDQENASPVQAHINREQLEKQLHEQHQLLLQQQQLLLQRQQLAQQIQQTQLQEQKQRDAVAVADATMTNPAGNATIFHRARRNLQQNEWGLARGQSLRPITTFTVSKRETKNTVATDTTELNTVIATVMLTSRGPANDSEIKENIGIALINRIGCAMNLAWMVWAVLQIISINLMFYGIKHLKYKLFLPHILLRAICFAACALFAALLGVALIAPAPVPASLSDSGVFALLLFLGSICIWQAYLMKSELRCCEFVKRSADTGFSMSHTRPLGQPTVSLSEGHGSGVGGVMVPRRATNGNMCLKPSAAELELVYGSDDDKKLQRYGNWNGAQQQAGNSNGHDDYGKRRKDFVSLAAQLSTHAKSEKDFGVPPLRPGSIADPRLVQGNSSGKTHLYSAPISAMQLALGAQQRATYASQRRPSTSSSSATRETIFQQICAGGASRNANDNRLPSPIYSSELADSDAVGGAAGFNGVESLNMRRNLTLPPLRHTYKPR